MKILPLTILLFVTMTVESSSNLLASEPLLQYLVRQPKTKNAHPPVIILLHGIGTNEKDLFSFADQLPASFLVISARAPYGLGGDAYAWYHADFSAATPSINKEEAEKSRNTIIEFIDQMQEKYHFDKTNVYLCGFSQGAIMAYSVGLTRPDKVKAIAVMSGRILEEVKPLISPKDKLRHLSVFISHGTKDTILDIHFARESNAYLKQLGINATYKEYPDAHTINNDMFTDLINWLSKN